jgi:hypothetical protein
MMLPGARGMNAFCCDFYNGGLEAGGRAAITGRGLPMA